MSIYARCFRVTVTLLALIAASSVARAASPSVTAALSNSEPAVGESVQLQIKVSGAMRAIVPETIPVDGLEIQKSGNHGNRVITSGLVVVIVIRRSYTFTR